AFAQSLHEQLATKQPELANQVKLKQMDLDFQREKLQTETQRALDVEALRQGIAADIAGLQEQLAMLKHERQLQASMDELHMGQAHDQRLAAQQQEAQSEQQAAGQDHEIRLAQQNQAALLDQQNQAFQQQQQAQQEQPE
ncbi:MAG TPA: hypothetical protein VGF59_25900, partial [Bryobacteraceae bacterium]